jgi:hypothetical protein
MSEASYEVVDDRVTTYMKFKITDCQGGVQFYTYDTVGSLTATFTIEVKLESEKIKTFKTDKIDGIPVYKYKSGADRIYKFADASKLKNIDLTIDGSNTVSIESKLYDNVSGIFIKANLTYLEVTTYSEVLDVNTFEETYGGKLQMKSNFEFQQYHPDIFSITDSKLHYIFKYSSGYSSAYYVVKLKSGQSLTDGIASITGKSVFSYTDVGLSIISNPIRFSKSVNSDSLFDLDSKYLRVTSPSLAGYSAGGITIFTYCGLIGKINEISLGSWKTTSDGYQYRQFGDIQTIDFIPT